MSRVVAIAALVFVSLLTASGVRAQTLTIEVDASVQSPAAPAVAGAGPVVVVRPEHDARVRLPEQPPHPEYTPPAVDDQGGDEAEIEGWGGFMVVVEGMDISQLGLSFDAPEIEALRGTELGSEWAGRAGLGETITGGFGLHLGMRAAGYFRGPELRLGLGGGDIEGDFAPVQVPGLEVALRSVFYARAELALGLQVPLGPVTPYVVATGSAGIALVEVDVRHAELGGLGSETLDAGLFGLGFEAGVDVNLDDDIQLGFAFRGSFVGTPSLGGAFRVSFGGG